MTDPRDQDPADRSTPPASGAGGSEGDGDAAPQIPPRTVGPSPYAQYQSSTPPEQAGPPQYGEADETQLRFGQRQGGEPAQPGQPQYGAPQQPGQPQYGQPAPGQYAPQQGQQPQQYGAPQFGQQPNQPQYGQQPGQPQYGQPQYAAPQQPGQPQPGQQYGAPQYGAPTPPPRKRRLGTGAVIGIIAGGLVLVIGAVVGIAAGINASRPASADPAATVTGYLDALRAGDAKKALTFLEKPADSTLLTPAVLKESNKLAKIGKATTTVSGSKYFPQVRARFAVGSESVTQEFRLNRDDDGTFTITNGTVSLLPSLLSGAPLKINGQTAPKGDEWLVFPGAYSLSLDVKGFQVENGQKFVAAGDDTYDTLRDVKVSLDDDGVQAFRDAVKTAVDACIASKNFQAGCGLDLTSPLSDGTILQEGTITRTLSADAQTKLANLDPDSSATSPLVVNGPYIGGVSTTATCTKGGATGTCSILFGPSLGSPVVDFTSGTPVVRWS